jgi:hypothetical protein
MHQNYCKGRLERVDPIGFQLVDELLTSVQDMPKVAPVQAMNEQQFAEWLAHRQAA